jgi:hemoglobin/transferrin/lactoferrin receptor protein
MFHTLIVLLLAAAPALALAASAARITGTATDSTGVPLAGVIVELQPGLRAETDASGRFSFAGLDAGTHHVVGRKRGFASGRQDVRLAPGETRVVHLVLALDRQDQVTVTATRGGSVAVFDTPEFVTVVEGIDLTDRRLELLPMALRQQPGVHVQQTSTSQGSPFVRGLTGQQVVILVDGVRYNNATFRPGANQYSALLDPGSADRIEIVHGPGSTQYGSDSLGGTINLVSRRAPRSFGSLLAEGAVSVGYRSADHGRAAAFDVGAARDRWSFAAGGRLRDVDDLRAGGGRDSHSVATRLLGLPADALGPRLRDTAYTQRDVRAQVDYRAGRHLVTLGYVHGAQDGASRYDQLDGGLGNLRHHFDPQALDLATASYGAQDLGPLDTFAATVSLNRQRDDRSFQNANTSSGFRARITDEENRSDVFGYQVQATSSHGRHLLAFGADLYDETVTATRRERAFDSATGDHTSVSEVRARFPNGAAYRSFGLYVRDTLELAGGRLKAVGGARFSHFRYAQGPDGNPRTADGVATVPLFRSTLSDVTFEAGAVASVAPWLNVIARAGRGFRAPNVNDYASVGVSGLGFEVSPDEAARMGATAGTLDGRSSSGHPVDQLHPERLLSFEAGLKAEGSSFSASAAIFSSDLDGLIERRSVLLPPGAAGLSLGGQRIVRQDASGAVYTALSSRPVFVRVNGGRVRFRGAEAQLRAQLGHGVTILAGGSTVRGEDLDTGAPPSVENGIPPAGASLRARWHPPHRRFHFEAEAVVADAQRRLSDNDRAQARIGGLRTREEIVAFWNGGAAARGLVAGGRLTATGETLDQVLARVLGPGGAPTLLFNDHPGYSLLHLRAGVELFDDTSLVVAAENVFDRNYRTMGSGVDGPGLSLDAMLTVRFGGRRPRSR